MVNSDLFWHLLRKHPECERYKYDTYRAACDAAAHWITRGRLVCVGQFERKWMVFCW